jgi:hypothetical protein
VSFVSARDDHFKHQLMCRIEPVIAHPEKTPQFDPKLNSQHFVAKSSKACSD